MEQKIKDLNETLNKIKTIRAGYDIKEAEKKIKKIGYIVVLSIYYIAILIVLIYLAFHFIFMKGVN